MEWRLHGAVSTAYLVKNPVVLKQGVVDFNQLVRNNDNNPKKFS